MPIPVTIPRLGWNMEEGTFVEWLKADGNTVRPGDAVFRLEGEKATEEIESLDGGTLHIPAAGPKPGDRLGVGAVIGYLLQPGEVAPMSSPASGVPQPLAERVGHTECSEDALPSRILLGRRSPPCTPRARRLALKLNVDWTKLTGSGRGGRIRQRDVASVASASPELPENVVPFTPIRRAIAAHMIKSHQTTAPVTLTSVVDATNLVKLRAQFKESAGSVPVPSYTDFFVKFAAVALQKHPLLTTRWTDRGLVQPEQINIGIAVDTDAGLLVPVVRDVRALGLQELAKRSRELIDRARKGALATTEMQGGCFTITNLGSFGIDAFTPIINWPECAVLGVGRIERRPVMDGYRVVGRELVTLSLTFDHRIVDGGPAARFLQTLAKLIENPGEQLS